MTLLEENKCIIGNSLLKRYIIENIVAQSSMDKKIDFNLLIKFLPNIQYRPERFPGIIYKPEKRGVTFLLFTSGKIVIVGGRSEEQIIKEILKFSLLIKKYA
jgi:transcription initiation factor TFIID TATA-box-binding protein